MPRPSPWNEHCTPDKLWMLRGLVDAGPAACWLALQDTRGDVHAAAARLITPERLERYASWVGLQRNQRPFHAGPPTSGEIELLSYLQQHAGEGSAMVPAVVRARVAAAMHVQLDPSAQQLANQLALVRRCGRVLVAAGTLATDEDPEHDPRVIADRLCLAVDLLPIADDWIVLPADQARERLGAVLARDQAYGSRLMDPSTARGIADLFAAMFPADATYLHNGDGEGGWTPVSTATMESAFAIAHPTRVGLAVVMDED